MDDLEKMWAAQAAQQGSLGLSPDSLTPDAKEQTSRNHCLGLYEEVSELTRASTRFKAHLLKEPAVDQSNVVDALADVLKFTLTMAQLHGVELDTLVRAFHEKTSVVDARIAAERAELENEKVLLCDLDGCVADLSSFQNRINALKTGSVEGPSIKSILEDLREDFYKSGGFRDIRAIDGSVECLDGLRAEGVKIVFITARPAWQYKRIAADTIWWLNAHSVPFDVLLFNKDKAEAVYENIHPAIPFAMVEDRSKHALEMVNIGVPVVLIDAPQNQDLPEHNLITRVHSWAEADAELRRLGRL